MDSSTLENRLQEAATQHLHQSGRRAAANNAKRPRHDGLAADSSRQMAEPQAPPQPPTRLLDLPGELLAQIWQLMGVADKDAFFCCSAELQACPGKREPVLRTPHAARMACSRL